MTDAGDRTRLFGVGDQDSGFCIVLSGEIVTFQPDLGRERVSATYQPGEITMLAQHRPVVAAGIKRDGRGVGFNVGLPRTIDQTGIVTGDATVELTGASTNVESRSW